MGEGSGEKGAGAASALREHAVVLGRVCMALLGDAAATEQALEAVARRAGADAGPQDLEPLVWLLGLARAACATQISGAPVRTGLGPAEAEAPDTRRDHAEEAVLARTALARLRPTERDAVVLHLVGGLDAPQVALACGVDVESARARLASGLTKLLEEGGR